jgi:hypothetical protein
MPIGVPKKFERAHQKRKSLKTSVRPMKRKEKDVLFLTCSSRLALTPFNSTLAGLRSSVVPGNRESVNTVLRTSFDPLSEGALL